MPRSCQTAVTFVSIVIVVTVSVAVAAASFS
jgi:hypothetical protein